MQRRCENNLTPKGTEDTFKHFINPIESACRNFKPFFLYHIENSLIKNSKGGYSRLVIYLGQNGNGKSVFFTLTSKENDRNDKKKTPISYNNQNISYLSGVVLEEELIDKAMSVIRYKADVSTYKYNIMDEFFWQRNLDSIKNKVPGFSKKQRQKKRSNIVIKNIVIKNIVINNYNYNPRPPSHSPYQPNTPSESYPQSPSYGKIQKKVCTNDEKDVNLLNEDTNMLNKSQSSVESKSDKSPLFEIVEDKPIRQDNLGIKSQRNQEDQNLNDIFSILSKEQKQKLLEMIKNPAMSQTQNIVQQQGVGNEQNDAKQRILAEKRARNKEQYEGKIKYVPNETLPNNSSIRK